MSVTYEITVQIRANGRVVQGFPLTRRLTCDGAQDATTEHDDEGAEADLGVDFKCPWNAFSLVFPKFAFITADGPFKVHPSSTNSNALYPICLNAGGFLLAVDMQASDGSTTASNQSFKVNNNGAATVERAIVGGDTPST